MKEMISRKTYKAILFDLDGTLTDTLEGLALCVNHAMDMLGLSHVTKDQCREYIGNGARILLQKSLMAVSGSDEKLVEAERIYADFFKEHCCDGVKVYPGLLELLQELKDRGYILGIMTNKPHEASCIVAKTLLREEWFSIVRGQIDGKPRKPESDIVEEVTGVLGVEISDCLFVGDSEVDAETGLNAGIDTVLCLWGFRSKQQLINAGAVNFVQDADELRDFIIGIGRE